MTALTLTLLLACRHAPGDKAPATDTAAVESRDSGDSTAGSDSGHGGSELPACEFAGPLPELEPCTDCTFIDIAITESGWCGIYTDGTVGCWLSEYLGVAGYALYDKLPSGTYTNIAAEQDLVCALREDGRICCMGEVGDEDRWNAPPTSPATQLAMHFQSGCVVMRDGSLQCFGYDMYGMLSEAPTSGTYLQASMGVFHACAVATDGHVDCWGMDEADLSAYDYNMGQVDDTPETIGYSSVWTTYDTNCALTPAGEATCWGAAGTHAQEALAPYSVKMTAVGGVVCAITTDNALICLNTPSDDWGNPTEGTWQKVVFGLRFPCALSTEGRVVCWDEYGEDLSPIYTTE